MHRREAAFFRERQRFGEFRLRFLREADDQVGRDRAAREPPVQQRDALEIAGAVVFSVHAAQYGVRAALQAQMELRAEILIP